MKQNSSAKTAKKNSASRFGQWSIMLVGEHGRVIPLRRFKVLAITIMIIFFLFLSGLIALSILYTQQVKQIQSLQSRLEAVQDKAEKLRLERDVNLVRREMQTIAEDPRPRSIEKTRQAADDVTQFGNEPVLAEREEASKSNAATTGAQDSGNKVKWGAVARDVGIGYDHEKNIISVRFKVHNTSQPRNLLSGRCVAVLKKKDDPSLNWLALPKVQLTEGKPGGDAGHEFRIQNYRTIDLKAIGPATVRDLNIATISIFSSAGDELFSKDYPFSIASPPRPISKTQPAPHLRLDHQNAPGASPESKVVTNPQPAPEILLPEHENTGTVPSIESRNENRPETSDPLSSNPEGEAS